MASFFALKQLQVVCRLTNHYMQTIPEQDEIATNQVRKF